MSAFKFIHCADLHVDSPLADLRAHIDGVESPFATDLRDASRTALANLIETAIEQKVAFVVMAGDIFDGISQDVRTGLHFIEQLRRLKEHSIQVFIAWGNHDAACSFAKKLNYGAELAYVFADYKPETVKVQGFDDVVLHGRSYPVREVRDNFGATYPPAIQDTFNIGVLHTNVGGKEGHDEYAPCNLEDLLAKNYQYWALGHVHTREILHQEPNCTIVYPGNLQGRNIREQGPRGAMLVTVDDNKIQSCEFIECCSVRWQKLSVNVEESDSIDAVIESVCTRLIELDQGVKCHVVQVSLEGNTPLQAELLKKNFRERPGLFEEMLYATRQTRSDIELQAIKLNTQDVSELLASIEDSSILDLLKIVEAEDSQTELISKLELELQSFKKAIQPFSANSEETVLRQLLDGDYPSLMQYGKHQLSNTFSTGE